MKMKKIKFNKRGDGPRAVCVEMSLEEAGFIALLVGKQSAVTAATIYPNSNGEHSEIYDCLVGDFFNRFWDAGVSGWARGQKPGEWG